MKSIYSYALLGALFAAGAANAATTTTTPVGYTTTTLVQGFNNIGLTLQQPLLVSDTASAVTATSVTATSASFASLTAGTTYILEVTSGTAAGTTVEVTPTTGSTTSLTTVDNLSAAGFAAGNTYQLRKAATLEDIFGTTGSVLAKAASVTNADVVWVPTSTPGSYTRYFQNTAGAWRSATANALAPNTPVTYLDGLFIERKAAATVALTLTGEVKKTGTNEALVTGFNYISTVYPAGSTLQNVGFDSALGKAASVTNADVVWVPGATPGSYTRYFLNTAGAWRNATTNTAQTTDVTLTTAVFIERKSTSTASATLKLVPPTAYSSL